MDDDKEFNPLKLNKNEYKSYGFYKTNILSNNQTISIYFMKEEMKNGYEYYVVLGIANKKRYLKEFMLGTRDLTSFETGKCGVEGLLWAKNQIIKFEAFIKDKHYKNELISIVVQWADRRRKKVYIRSLKPLGYRLVNRYGEWCLYKKIK